MTKIVQGLLHGLMRMYMCLWDKRRMEMKKAINDLLKLDLQYFAEPEPEPEPTPEPEPEPEKVELTADELQKKIEAESDRKLQKSLEKKKQEWQAETDQKIKDAIAENERLSKLSEKQRKDEEMTQREKQIADRLAELERKELRADAVADLNEKELPSNFADFLLAENAEKTLENITSFKKTFDDAVNEKVKEALRQDTPKSSSGKTSAITKEQFSKMNYSERAELYEKDLNTYNKLTKGD